MADDAKPAAPDPPLLAKAVQLLRGAYVASVGDPHAEFRYLATIKNGHVALEVTEALDVDAFTRAARTNTQDSDAES